MTQTQRSPLARLVLCMVCLAVAGTILAGGHYLAVDLPLQNSVQMSPHNSIDSSQEMSPEELLMIQQMYLQFANKVSMYSNLAKQYSNIQKEILGDLR